MVKKSAGLPFTDPDKKRYFEDYVVGNTHTLGEVLVDGDEMVEFAKKFDPQDFHINESKALAGPFKGLIASGWYTGSLMMPLFAQHYLSNASSLASPGFDKLEWLAPVRAGDRLTVSVKIVEKKLSKTKPDRGIVKSYLEIQNQNKVVVMTIYGINMIAARPDPE